MTLLNTSGVLVILTVILLLWFVPRSLRRAPAGSVMEPERPLISAERTAEDILASAGVLLNESEAYQSSDHAVAPGTSLPSSALPQASSRSSHTVEEPVQPAPDTASISQIRESSPTAPYTDEIPVVEESKPSLLSYVDTSSPSGIALLVAAGLGVLALITGLLALFAGLAWGWAVLFLILAGGAWAVSRFGLLESLAHQVKENRDERRAKAEAEDAENNDAEDEAYEGSDDEETYADASESAENPVAEGMGSESAEEPEPQARPITRGTATGKPATRKSAGNVNREAARPSRAHIAVEASEDAPEAAAREEAPAPSQAARPVRPAPTRSTATRSTEPPAAHRQERRQQRPSRFQPIRRGSVLFDQESSSATRASSAAPRTAGQPQVAQAQVSQSQPVQPQPVQSAQPAQSVQQAPAPAAQPVAPQSAQSAQPAQVQQAPAQASAQPVAAAAQQPAIHPDQPVARQALRDGSPVRQAPAAPAAQPIPEEIPLPDVLDDSEFDALDIASLNDPALSTGTTATGGVRSTNRHPGAGSSFEAVSNTWNPVQLPKPLSALHRQDQGKNQGKK
ncbi:phage holin family protein [uncultured Rothia sp.]|uniref:phage holin family protein n=1 Tax=uncultured Rothia sp. TaxID=316088 RepID=UPI0028DBD250|nr:phage holin family protein [uncultured Rothia sp.]